MALVRGRRRWPQGRRARRARSVRPTTRPPRMALTVQAVRWAVDALSCDDTTVSALARHLGVDWHTCWDAVEVEAKARVADPARRQNVKTLGVDEHIVRREALLFRMEVRD